METSEVGLHNLVFPIFKIGKTKPLFKDGVYYFMYGADLDSEDEQVETKVLDDQNMSGESLAARRLALAKNSVPMHKLGIGLFFIADLIKVADAQTWFIDSAGTVFNYRKSTRVKLVFRPIEQVIPIRTGGAVIVVKGIPSRFKVLHAPNPALKYAGLLLFKNSYILYGLFDQQYDTTFRLI